MTTVWMQPVTPLLTYGKDELLREASEDYYKGGDFMGGYHWEQIVILLLDKIENMKAHKEEMNREIDRLMEENVRLNQLLRDRDMDIDQEKKERSNDR